MGKLTYIKPWHVYVVSEGAEGPCKIGRSVDPARRLSGIQGGNPRLLTLEYIERGPGTEWSTSDETKGHYALEDARRWAVKVEHACHIALRPRRISGEWFSVTVAEAIEAVKAVGEEVLRG